MKLCVLYQVHVKSLYGVALHVCINVIVTLPCCTRSSGSMEPAFYRGDLLFLTNYQEEPIQAGEILVFKVKGRDIPIVHRVIKLHEK